MEDKAPFEPVMAKRTPLGHICTSYTIALIPPTCPFESFQFRLAPDSYYYPEQLALLSARPILGLTTSKRHLPSRLGFQKLHQAFCSYQVVFASFATHRFSSVVVSKFLQQINLLLHFLRCARRNYLTSSPRPQFCPN